MLLVTRQILDAQASDATKTFKSVDAQLDSQSLSYILTVDTTGFAGSLDIQGRESPSDSWKNMRYQLIEREMGLLPIVVENPTDDQLKYNGESVRRRYLIPIAATEMRLVVVRGRGTISAWARGSGNFIEPFNVAGAEAVVEVADEQLIVLKEIKRYLRSVAALSDSLIENI